MQSRKFERAKLPSFLFGDMGVCVDFNLKNQKTKTKCKNTTFNAIS